MFNTLSNITPNNLNRARFAGSGSNIHEEQNPHVPSSSRLADSNDTFSQSSTSNKHQRPTSPSDIAMAKSSKRTNTGSSILSDIDSLIQHPDGSLKRVSTGELDNLEPNTLAKYRNLAGV